MSEGSREIDTMISDMVILKNEVKSYIFNV